MTVDDLNDDDLTDRSAVAQLSQIVVRQRKELDTLRSIAARVRSGWTPVPQHNGPPCWIRSGWHGDIEHDTLTKAEATALYGTEEPSPS